MRSFTRLLPAALLLAAACNTPDVAPGLDQYACDGGLCGAPGAISGSVVYAGTARGDVVIFLWDTASLPPPDGTATAPVSIARVSQAALFGGAPASSSGPFSASYAFPQVPAGHTYQLRAFLDATHDFDPFFDFTQQPRAGDPVGGYATVTNGKAQLAPVAVAAGQVVSNVDVALAQVTAYDPPAFQIAAGAQLDVNMDRPARLRLQTTRVGAQNATFADAHFALELDRDANGRRRSTAKDGLDDVYPKVLLRQLTDGSGAAVQAGAVVPCRVNPLPLLPGLVNLADGQTPLATDTLDVLVEPLALSADLQHALPSIPKGAYQVVVIERSGQAWTVPNSLGDPARAGTPYGVASQGQTVAFGDSGIPGGSISGQITYAGGAVGNDIPNVIVQAYLDDPQNPPPPVGAALPARVQILNAYNRSGYQATASGFTLNYQITGLQPGKRYLVEALADLDGNFSPLNLLQTPTRGDAAGAVLDAHGLPASISVTGAVANQNLTLSQVMPLDPPAFEVQGGAGMDLTGAAPVRFSLTAKPLAFPVGAGSAQTTQFTVTPVIDPTTGKTVDADGDGLPDVWPRVFLVKLDPSDPTDLTPAAKTTVIPAAVDPTPFLPALAAGTTVLTSKVTVIARPVFVDAATRAVLPRTGDLAGRYKVVVVNQTGQVWQVPNEAAPQALDASVVCAASAAACAPGTVQTQGQGTAFTVSAPAAPPAQGAIVGTLTTDVAGFAGAWIFAVDAANPPPPAGTGQPVTGDYHPAAQFSGGAVSYTLAGLDPSRRYYVTALVDTRGDFAVAPQLFAAAPGEGTVVGGHLDSSGHLVPVAPAIPSGTAPGQSVAAVANAANAVAFARPSFVVRDASSASLLSQDATTLFPDAVHPQRILLEAQPVLAQFPALRPEADAPKFPVRLQCLVAGNDADQDGLPDLFPRVLVVRLSDDDPTGLTPDPAGIVIPAAVDPTPFQAQLGTCAAPAVVTATDLPVVLAPIAVRAATGQQQPIPPGRYGITLVSATGQVWRVPNELQPALLDGHVNGAQLASQSVAIRVGSQVPAAAAGGITGLVHLSGYAGATGSLVVSAYAATALPPPNGLGRPLAVQVVPQSVVSAAATGPGILRYTLANLAPGNYVVVAMLDTGHEFSALLDYTSGPGFGTQTASTTAVTVGSAVAGAPDLSFASGSGAIAVERPSFAVDAASVPVLSQAKASVALSLDAVTPPGLAYAVSSGANFHPQTTGARDATTTCGANTPFIATTQVYVTPLDTGSTLVPRVQLNQCQFCLALTGDATCGAAPLATPAGLGQLTAVVQNVAIDPATKTVVAGNVPAGHYAITVVEATGETWTLPNALGGGNPATAQGAVFTVTP